MSTFVENQTLETINCCNCGVMFAMPETWLGHYRKNHQLFYCPAGHSQHFPAESAEEKLRKEVARLQTQREHAEARANDLRAQRDTARHQRDGMKGAYRKVAVRVKNGVCPCCNRTFKCLADHMAQKHPDFQSTPTVP